MTFDILTFIAIIAAFFVFVGWAYWVGYRNGYRKGGLPVASGMAQGIYGGIGIGGASGRGGLGGAGGIPDYEDGSPMP
jgi:hypothetical protein